MAKEPLPRIREAFDLIRSLKDVLPLLAELRDLLPLILELIECFRTLTPEQQAKVEQFAAKLGESPEESEQIVQSLRVLAGGE